MYNTNIIHQQKKLLALLNKQLQNTTPIIMSSFTIRTDRKQNSNRRRVGGRRSRPTGQQGYTIGAFLKASQKVAPTKPCVDSNGFVTVIKRNRSRRQSPLSRRVMVKPSSSRTTNAFAVLATSPPTTIAGPAVVKPVAPKGVWGKGPKKKVSFANDSETLMKPTAVETREYEKGSVTTAFVKYPAEEEYLKLKRSKGAWRPKSVPQVKEECQKDVYDERVKLNRAAYEVFNQVMVPTYIGSWADACDSDSEDETDDFGRPTTDNSAW